MPDPNVMFKDLDKAIEAIPRLLGGVMLRFYQDSWQRQGYVSQSYEAWKLRAQPDASEARYGRRAVLVRRGHLRRSLRLRVKGRRVTVYTNKPYAQIHNEGGTVSATQAVPAAKVKAHTRKLANGTRVSVKTYDRGAYSRKVSFRMPQRQFMDVPGEALSPVLERRLFLQLQKYLSDV